MKWNLTLSKYHHNILIGNTERPLELQVKESTILQEEGQQLITLIKTTVYWSHIDMNRQTLSKITMLVCWTMMMI